MYWIPGLIFKDQTVAVLASGPSMSREVADSTREMPRIAINTTYQLARDADIFYGADALWWREYEDDLRDLPGLKVSIESNRGVHPNCPDFVRVMRWGGNNGFDDRPGYMRSGTNSGCQAVHLAATLGAKKILMFGFDMHGMHWHGKHPMPLANPNDHAHRRFIKQFALLAPELKQRGIEVINCTPGSALECFNKTDFAEA